jgi:hypothetical protein
MHPRIATCPTASDPTSQLRWAPDRQWSDEELKIGRDLMPPRVLWLRTPPPCKGRLRCRHRMPYGFLWTAGLKHKKSLTGMPVQLGAYAPNARTSVSKASDVKVIMGLQDVRSGSAVNAYKTCKHVAIVHRWHRGPLTWHCYSVKRPDSTMTRC